jgi:hypothetical protein
MCRALDLTETQWRSLVVEGFNDIDLRCNDYLNWLAAKQSEKVMANQTFSGLTGVLGGLAVATGAGAAAEIGYAALALGFGATVYNAYHEIILLGLGAPNVIALVDARRAKFKSVFGNTKFTSLPDVEFVLRSYLRICTPAAIITDFSISASSNASGQQNPIDARIQEAPASISTYVPTQATERANVTKKRGDLPKIPVLDLVFVGGARSGWTTEELVELQAAFCIPENERGKVNDRIDDPTIATVKRLTARKAERRIDETTYNAIMGATIPPPGGKGDRCNLKRYQNYFENSNYRATPMAEKTLLETIAKLPKVASVGGTLPTSFEDSGARALIHAAREACGLGNSKPFADQVTPDLISSVFNPTKCGRTQ